MPLNRIFTLLLFSSMLFMGCKDTTNPKKSSTWFGGEIVNPKLDYLVLNKGRQVIDTIQLNNDNTFSYEFKNLEQGMYSFSHREFQIFYLEPGDSLMLRVNTIEFDESLAFSGIGAEKNNLLIDLFLLNENVDDQMNTYSNLSPEVFLGKMDSIQNIRNDKLKRFLIKNSSSEAFTATAKGIIDYGIMAKKELYVSTNSKRQVYDESVTIPPSFYDYRNVMNLNDEVLKDSYTYYRAVDYYLDNLSFEAYKGTAPFKRLSFLHSKHKMNFIDSLITMDVMRNRLLRNTVGRHVLNGGTAEEKEKIVDIFKTLSSNPADILEMTKLSEAVINLSPGREMPNMLLLTAENTVKDLHSILTKPTVLYFWSDASVKHYRKIHTRAAELHSKYPEYDFIGINVDTHFKKWLRVIKNSGYAMRKEFQLNDNTDAETKLVLNSMNKAIILDANGIILDGNTNIQSTLIENDLLALMNQ